MSVKESPPYACSRQGYRDEDQSEVCAMYSCRSHRTIFFWDIPKIHVQFEGSFSVPDIVARVWVNFTNMLVSAKLYFSFDFCKNYAKAGKPWETGGKG